MAATMAATIEAEARFMRKWKSDAPTAEEFKRRIPFLEYLLNYQKVVVHLAVNAAKCKQKHSKLEGYKE
uniref:hypothetical protein n=1 Tax=Acinetobacter baumannii TaxID=470 RepID=UPI001E30959E|nr:hypothetical protein [Acinetobacter baumannii]